MRRRARFRLVRRRSLLVFGPAGMRETNFPFLAVFVVRKKIGGWEEFIETSRIDLVQSRAATP
jgi:hypothetical protein